MEELRDPTGQQLLAQLRTGAPTAEIIERDDNMIAAGSDAGMYFSTFDDWSSHEQRAIKRARGKVLDIGAGAGRHSLYLQQRGCEVTAIDSSPGAIEVCRARGIRDARVLALAQLDVLDEPYDTVVMLGNNFGLFGSAEGVAHGLAKLARTTTPDARIVAGTMDPYTTDDPEHLAYHRHNRERGRMSGQLRFRVRYRKAIGDWFDYLLVSRDEMKDLVSDTAWQVAEWIDSGGPGYVAVLTKR